MQKGLWKTMTFVSNGHTVLSKHWRKNLLGLMGFDKWRASTRHSELWNSRNHSLCKPLLKWRNAIWPNNNHYNYIQPLDISVNKSDKNFLQHHVHEWYTQQTCQQLKGMVPQDLKLSIKSPKFLAKSSNYKILCKILINSHVIYEPWKLIFSQCIWSIQVAMYM